MIDRKALKAKAKEYAFSHKMVVWKPMLYIMAISFVFSLILSLTGVMEKQTLYSLLTTLFTIATMPLAVGAIQYIMKTKKGETVEVMDVFKKKYKLFVPILVMTIVMGVLVGIGFALLVIPGIILALRYSMAQLIAAEAEDELDGIGALKRSAKLMDGHKWDYFVFCLSFIGWYLLCGITFGIACIWVFPYITVAEIDYYEELKKLEK